METFSESTDSAAPAEKNRENAPAENDAPAVRIKIVGVGGAASRTVARLCESKKIRAEFFAVDTSSTDLAAVARAGVKPVLIGENIVGGIGTGASAKRGAQAAAASAETLREMLAGADLLLLVASLGRGTGSGASVEILKIALEIGIVSVCFATTPFSAEGADSTRQASLAIDVLHARSNAFVLIENNLIAQSVSAESSFSEGFKISDRWLEHGISACCRMLDNRTGRMNIDFAAFRSLFPTPGARTLFSIGGGEGANAQEAALNELFHSPLLKTVTACAEQSETLAVHIETGTDPKIALINETVQRVSDRFGGGNRVLLSYAVNPDLGERAVEICVFGASGFHRSATSVFPKNRAAAAPSAAAEPDVLVLSGDFGTAQKNAAETLAFTQMSADEKTSDRLFEGKELDTPTYVRRGINLDTMFATKKKELDASLATKRIL